MNRGILNFLNQLDEGKRGKSNSFAERVANFLTPNDEFEYRGGLLSNMDEPHGREDELRHVRPSQLCWQ